MKNAISRRNAIKGFGAAIVAGNYLFNSDKSYAQTLVLTKKEYRIPGVPVTCIVIGAGNRGQTYAGYAAEHSAEIKIVGVAEPIALRREAMAQKYNIKPVHCFTSWEEVFSIPRFADAVIIATPDRLHYGPYMKACEKGYHIMVEKPMATSEQECIAMVEAKQKANVMVAVCHVLRYTPYFIKVRELCASGILGNLVTVQHLEPIGYWHMAHSYVRGNWRDSNASSPIILAKSSHDLDIISWITGKRCKTVEALGSLRLFKPENAPAGSTKRCTDKCPAEKDCPYSALKLYMDMNRTGWPVSVITDDMSYDGRLKALTEGPYGRCVYRCDNNQPDNIVVNMNYEDNLTVSFTMSAFTKSVGDRKTCVMGTAGELTGDMHTIALTDFRNGKTETIDTGAGSVTAGSGHGGGDYGLVRDFVQAIAFNDSSFILSGIEDSLESHILAFRIEESRIKKQVMKV